MDMIFVMIELLDENLRIVLGDVEQFPFHIGKESLVEDFPAVFGRKDEVVVAEPDTMMALAISAFHTSYSITARERRCGYAPPSPPLRDGVFVRE